MSNPFEGLGGSTLIFDLDGTMIDTAPDLRHALNHALAHEDLPSIALDDMRAMVGLGSRRLIEIGLDSLGREVKPDLVDRLSGIFLEHYADNIAADSRPFDGSVGCVDQARSAGLQVGMCTNKLEYLARLLLTELSLLDRFDSLIGGDTVGVSKPEPQPLWEAIERAGGNRDRALMIGDSQTDVNAARAAGVPVVVVSFGYTATPPAELGGDLVIDHFADLPHAAQQLLGPT